MTNLNNKPCVKCGSTDRYKPGPGHKLGNCKACQKANANVWRKANPKKIKSKDKAYRENNRKKRTAHEAIAYLVRTGKLPKVLTCTCVDCGIPAAEYHHEDYSKPLEVVALCKKCHAKRHHPSTNELTNYSHQT